MTAIKRTKKVRVGADKEVELTTNKDVQDGVNPRSKLGGTTPNGKATIGLSIGVTLNMGNYQSARIDVFIQRNVEDTEEDIKDGLSEISELLHDEVERQSALLDVEDE